MTTAIFIQDGVVQLVLTPETPWEETAVKMLGEGEKRLSIVRGSFYETRGGWTRYGSGHEYGGVFGGMRDASDDKSLIIRVAPPSVEGT